MRTQILFSVFVGIAVSGCGNSGDSQVPRSDANTDSSDEGFWHDVPYLLVETMPDGSHLVQYCVESMQPQTLSTMDSGGREEIRSVMVAKVEEQRATVPPGEDISDFLSGHANGKIVNREPSAHFDEYVEPAPYAPPAPPES